MCRICWNVERWSRPSGSAASHETGSYVSEHGFGHEEWLLNFEWMIDDRRDGFVQVIHKNHAAYEGKTFPILLYTITPDRSHLAVALIRKAYVPTQSELALVYDEYSEHGWLDRMCEDLRRINIETAQLANPTPREIANVRFTPDEVKRFDPMPRFIPGERGAPNVSARYMAFHWDGRLDFLGPNNEAVDLGAMPEDDPRRSEAIRRRAAQRGVEVDPKSAGRAAILPNSRDRAGGSRLCTTIDWLAPKGRPGIARGEASGAPGPAAPNTP